MIVGSGQFKYRVNAEWAKLPDGWSFKEVGGVGVDDNDNVYVFNRGELHPRSRGGRAVPKRTAAAPRCLCHAVASVSPGPC